MTKTNKQVLRGLYAILDTATLSSTQDPIHCAEQAILGGCKLLQYRDKTQDTQIRQQHAQQLRALCTQHQVLLIINDDLQLAQYCHADGIHLGRDDATLPIARKILGDDLIIGVSCYNDFARAQTARTEGADYIAFGAFFPSPTKPQAVKAELTLLARAKQELSTPVCAIGGITAQNGPALIAEGADMLAVITNLFCRTDIQFTAKQFTLLFDA